MGYGKIMTVITDIFVRFFIILNVHTFKNKPVYIWPYTLHSLCSSFQYIDGIF